ncbi:TRAP transporter small permease subunit [Natranaerofaba carboxydovora]|uniref:TRAP transporter small permease subunit n=1 Tax=Natranaerofaba carboxydovora TaxID=2742683 RepID=UPI001F136EC7|nr:TRAP transporter small permease subunit [Natranaerofaba carboxydovora]UMZ72627.1 Tripartite ATP-independent periplasmic transporter, DctQ component [Natranaerofaba carboxydovora]
MGRLTRIIGVIDKINDYAARAVQWFVLILVVTLVYEVIMRYVFNSPTLWSFDVSYMSASIFLMLGMGYTLKEGGHVNIDIIVGNLSRRNQAILNLIFFAILFFPLWFSVLYAFTPNLINSWAIGETAAVGTWRPPIYPYKTWLYVGMFLLLIQGISEFLKELLIIFRGEE